MAWYSINLESYKFSKSLFVPIRYFMERTAPHNIRPLITKDIRWEGFHPGKFSRGAHCPVRFLTGAEEFQITLLRILPLCLSKSLVCHL